jgi:hypothetical protein
VTAAGRGADRGRGTPADAGRDAFEALAAPLLRRPGVTSSTMMGLPCLRVDGAFFAACDRRSGDLLVKLDERRVGDLVGAGLAGAFAPAGRRFRQWAAVPPDAEATWAGLLDEALRFAAGPPPA